MIKFIFLLFITSSINMAQIIQATYINKIFFLNDSIGWIGVDNENYKTTNAGSSWIKDKYYIGNYCRSMNFINENTGFAVINGFLLKTTNQGLTWNNVYYGNTHPTIYADYCVFINEQYGYIIQSKVNGAPHAFKKTTDSGLDWDSLSISNVYNMWVHDSLNVTVKTRSDSLVTLLRTTNGGFTWNVQLEIIGVNIIGLCFFKDSPIGFGSPNLGFLKTTDDGNTWFIVDSNKYFYPLMITDSASAFNIYYDGARHIAKTIDRGQTWTERVYPYADGTITMDHIWFADNENGFASNEPYDISKRRFCKTTDGGYTWECFPLNVVTSQEETFTQSNYTLQQNYPNPFNPSTKIKYTLPKQGLVNIKVYDVLGKEIIQLVNEEKPSGEYEVEFDGSSLSSGIYFYQIQAGEFLDTKKMVLMK